MTAPEINQRVEQGMTALHASTYGTGAGKRAGRTPQEQERLQRDIESTDQAIDALVYQLYGLTEAEIKIVEGS
jgi:hypothetical protein